MENKLPKLIVILGPTASGKTDLAIKLAKKLAPYRTCLSRIKLAFVRGSGAGFNGEIVSADSRQIYKGMDIGTAKAVPTKQTRNKKTKLTRNMIQGIPHYMINVVNPDQEFNVAIYKKMAMRAIKDIQKQEKLPFLVGGTGLYIRAIVDNIDFPKVKPQQKLRKRLKKKSVQELFKIYKTLDPQGAKVIDKNNKRRLIRAIEVCKISGESFWQQRKKGAPLFDVLQIGIKLPKKELEKRIKKRVEKMFKAGLKKEVEKLVKKYGLNIPSLQTIGYQEWKQYLKGNITKDEVKKMITLHTIQFTKRQMTWFKRDKRIHWIKNYRQADNLIKRFL